MVLLPTLVFGAQVERARVLQVRGKDDRLVAGLTRELDTQVPRVERDEGELEVVGLEVFLGELVEAGDGVAEGASVPDVFPRERGQAGWSGDQRETSRERRGEVKRSEAYCTEA